MSCWFSDAWPGTGTAIRQRRIGERILRHFLIDLVVSVSIVVGLGSLFQATAGDAYVREALVTQNEVYVAISRFAPQNIALSYGATVDRMTRGLIHGFDPSDGLGAAVGSVFGTVCRLAMQIALAAPHMFAELYRQTSGAAGWIVLAGFAMTGVAIVGWLIMTRASVWRLLAASVLSPVAVSVMFMMLQGFMVLLLHTFIWLPEVAPYAVGCPVLCTLYWVMFPNAEHGATCAVLHAIGRRLERPAD